jgi:amino acid transporter
MTGVGVQICRGSFVFGQLVCHTLITIDSLLFMLFDFSNRDLSNGIVDVIIGVSMCLQFFLLFFIFYSLLSLYKLQEEKREKKKSQEHTKTLVTTTLVKLKRSQKDEFNDIKKGH